ncbi:MAG TPA: tRNA (adenosine(37)-N6)-threonylcarbamoyltransferase complex ATPase subunit type 1 TsaE [Levilinea sp.]|nr:tRNA (adenosine(37)-N6)-threonylcarbamoyltransferase complex ATPase subunit type 1 TsaE [Levilinea sp.]
MPILNQNTLEFVSRSPEQTRRLGMRLGALMQAGDIVCLAGDLGSGKTTLVQGITRGWGSLDPVSSPTFVLVNVYQRPDQVNLHHMDAYRLDSLAEAEELDLDALLENGVLVIEWADHIRAVIPGDHLWIEMRWNANEQRGMVFLAHGSRHENLLAAFRRRAFGG